jgi:isocitrate/isopropylmalate dehydrogenase
MSTAPSAPVRIVVMEGDGIGPEITAATMEVVRAVDARFKLGLSFTPVAIGLAALRAHGTTLPEAALAAAKAADGVRRPQSVGRAAQVSRPVCQHPPSAQPRRLAAPLRLAGRPRHRAREHRGLLC